MAKPIRATPELRGEEAKNFVKKIIQAEKTKLTKKEIAWGLKELKKVYNKGFSSGFFLGVPSNDDFSKAQHSMATQKKEFVGRVIHYFSDKKVGAIRIFNGKLKINDEILVIGSRTGVVNHKIKRIEINRKPVVKAEKGQEIGIKSPNIKKGDNVYIILKK